MANMNGQQMLRICEQGGVIANLSASVVVRDYSILAALRDANEKALHR